MPLLQEQRPGRQTWRRPAELRAAIGDVALMQYKEELA
jgi:hypothetical protein